MFAESVFVFDGSDVLAVGEGWEEVFYVGLRVRCCIATGEESFSSARQSFDSERVVSDPLLRKYEDSDGTSTASNQGSRVSKKEGHITYKVILLDTGDGIRIHPRCKQRQRRADEKVAEIVRLPCSLQRRRRALRVSLASHELLARDWRCHPDKPQRPESGPGSGISDERGDLQSLEGGMFR